MTALVKKRAEKAFQEGHKVFVTRGEAQPLTGPHSEVAALIEAVESEGWRLDQMSHYLMPSLATYSEIGVFVFRRSEQGGAVGPGTSRGSA
jgi:hypothetical protein